MAIFKLKSSSSIFLTVIGSGLGNVVEWYSFLAYAYLAPVLSKLFFPDVSEKKSIIFVFLIFAIGFLARPVGAIFFGYLGDKIGRRKTLVWSQLMMAVPSLLICFIPTYEQIGFYAAILLSILRFVQGFSIAGEYTTSLCYIAEMSPQNRRGFYTSTIPSSTAIGILISSFITLAIIHYFEQSNSLYTYGWRVSFFIGFLLNVIVIFIRLMLKESAVYTSQKKELGKISLKKFVSLITKMNVIKQISIVILLVAAYSYFYQLIYIWNPTFLETYLKKSNDFALSINGFSMIIFAFFILVGGFVSDYVGRKKIIIISSLIIIISFAPLFYFFSTGMNDTFTYLYMFLFSVVFGFYVGTSSALFSEIFDIKIRSTTLALSYNIPYAIVGGLTPALLSSVVLNGSYTNVIYITIGVMALAFITSLFVKETFKKNF
jgi:MFS transporter, MHS family, proline/betaine transporter